ncbi:hypothetical protein CSPAE12_02273 [Colletotrichum incanum]|nr:hypothetical protein CSPAE12_02273 [Colletotrichum incanum]
MDVPELLEALATQATTGGFKPINGPKRPLTPSSSVTISSPFKRLAVEIAPNLATAPEHDIRYRALPERPPTFDAKAEAAEQCLLPDLVQTPPSTSDAEIEMPETSPSTPLPPGEHIAVIQHQGTDSWMSEFVNLDKVGGECFIPFEGMPAGYHNDATQTLSNADAVMAKPFPDLDVEHLGQVTQEEEVTVKASGPDDYCLEDSDEEEMAQLLAVVDGSPAHIPPSNMAWNMDQDSRAAESFDSKLQFSTPYVNHCETSKDAFSEPDLLDEDVDWDVVTACAKEATSSTREHYLVEAARMHTTNALSVPNPIVKPPFPPKMRDRSVVVGLSSATMMRTCFRIGELLNAHAKCTREKQDVALELFARVNYSNRETSAKVQHFQLRDLFTDKQPFLSGAFRGWKLNGPVDHHSSAFLGPNGKNKLCRCVCKLSEDKKAAIGRSATILSIRQTTWDEVQWGLRLVSRDAASGNNGHDEGMIFSAT